MTISRRQFIKATALSAGALTLGFNLQGCKDGVLPHASGADLQPNAFLQLTPDGELILQLHKVEMGQGTMTGFATLVAEELQVNPETITIEHAQAHTAFADPVMFVQVTGGSTSIANSFEVIRHASATMRELLLQAAANYFSTEPSQLRYGGYAIDYQERRVAYQDLVPLAKTLPVPGEVTLRSPDEFTYIGRYTGRVDAHDKVTGKAVFTADLNFPNMKTAVVLRPPRFGGAVASIDAGNLPTNCQVIEVSTGIAVVSDSYWNARKGAQALVIEWADQGLLSNTEDIYRAQQGALTDDHDAVSVRSEGRSDLFNGDSALKVQYRAPFLAHAAMEPLVAIANVTTGHAEIWAGNQAPDVAQAIVAEKLGFDRQQVQVNNTLLGGGFGRKVVPDFIVEAAEIAAHIDGPVKLQWSREDDTRHDFYRPAMTSQFEAWLDQDEVLAWKNHLVGPSINRQLFPLFGQASLPQWVPKMVPKMMGGFIAGEDFSSVEGAKELPYDIPAIAVDYTELADGVPIGYWRSVGHSQNAFFVESFIDEVAVALKQDPLRFRQQHLKQHPRHLAVLNKAAEMANWGNSPAGRFQGLAVHHSFGSYVAQVIEISIANGQPKLHKVYCAVDCGLVVNPDMVVNQMESGIIFGLTAALKGEITLTNGAVEQSNFHDYPMLRINEVPDIAVAIIDSNEPPTGVGEPGVPPAAPALANAIFQATGQRIRQLPLALGVS